MFQASLRTPLSPGLGPRNLFCLGREGEAGDDDFPSFVDHPDGVVLAFLFLPEGTRAGHRKFETSRQPENVDSFAALALQPAQANVWMRSVRERLTQLGLPVHEVEDVISEPNF